MSGQILPLRHDGDLTQFDPTQTRARLRQLGEVIAGIADEARRGDLSNWPLLIEAAEAKVAEQTGFVADWNARISGRESQGSNQWSSADRGSTTVRQHEQATGISHQMVARWRGSLGMTTESVAADPEAAADYADKIIHKARQAAGLDAADNHRAEGTGEFEWYTPPRYIAAARAVMGTIDLDPATHVNAQRTVQATKYFTIADDGLAQEWHGKVWLNPPYAQPAIEDFAKKMVEEVGLGHTTEAVMLTHNYTDTAWFHIAASACAMICFTRGRIRFININGQEADSPTQGQAFFYYGSNLTRFADVFGPIGLLVSRYV
jgi:ParB family chromosome partitioning protein